MLNKILFNNSSRFVATITQKIMIFSLLITILLSLTSIHAIILQDINPCLGKLSCHDCIQTKGCAFCSEEGDFSDRSRCFKPELHTTNERKCHENYTINPDTEIKIEINNELTRHHISSGSSGTYISGGGIETGGSSYSSSFGGYSESSYGSSYNKHMKSSQGQVVQVSPQKMNLKLRINQEARFQIHYAQAVDYPVDLYYLMDLSKSMEDDKEKLSKLGDLLSATMNNITSNFRLGFGSFVDKVLMPYVSTVPKKLKNPCDGCEAPYGFRNHMPLSNDTKTFSTEVRKAAVSGNLDAPEGGFDAIMQAIVCDSIGWRKQARHLLVFSTDAGFHYAGDGKLGGVITPNDGKCHLDGNGYYTHSTVQDYPSISQINQKVRNNSINIIFAVTQSQIEIYRRLVEHIEGSSSAVLSSDSSNVVDIIKEEYSKISSSVEMKTNIASDYLKAKFYSSCLSGGELIETSKCDGLKVGDVVSFTVELVATSCEQNTTQTFKIYPVGLNEGTEITVELICDCNCEQPGNPGYQEKAKECHYSGTLKCGVCHCLPGYFGENCECSTEDIENINQNKGCRPENTTLECSGRGQCICGKCKCDTRDTKGEEITGKYCQCDNFSCERKNNDLCSNKGKCICGQCFCNQGWSGSDCSCSTDNGTCIDPNNPGVLCNGHGRCECGKCICDATNDKRFSGTFCNRCPSCGSHCFEFKHCVECMVFKSGQYNEEECKEKCENTYIFEFVNETVQESQSNENEYFCALYDDDDCKYQFIYYENKTLLFNEKIPTTTFATPTNVPIQPEKSIIIIKMHNERECPPKVFMLGIVLGVIAAIVLIGLAIILLWKLLTTIHDRREFARFEKERMMAKWDTGENPIYKQATSTFKNPTYGK